MYEKTAYTDVKTWLGKDWKPIVTMVLTLILFLPLLPVPHR